MLDRKGKRARWTKARASENLYSSRLLQVARQVGVLVRGLNPDGSLSRVAPLVKVLKDYAQLIEPWAASVAAFMLADVERRDLAMWKQNSKDIAKGLRRELAFAPTGEVMQQLQAAQVKLIKSIPLEAAQRVHDIAQESMVTGKRADVLAKEILNTENVTAGRARTIARTETSRAASNLVQARSQYAGSDGYIWRTSGDSDVRDSHKEMEGVYVRWAVPPTLDNMKGHAGCLPNCRCWAEPVFPDL